MGAFREEPNVKGRTRKEDQHALALFVFNYNFWRVHQTLRVTPAMEAGLADHVWEFEEIPALLK